ncbi:MAG: DUF4115 domain-containing protein [Chloroflexi bacterium]|nr:DUF4115 domain-containing protein [Chloroflexota bacterium]
MDAQSLGRYLRETREARELTLDDAEQSLRIRRRILESFELGDFTVRDASAVQIRGFIRNYARYLGLDEDRVVAHYDASLVEAQRRNGKRRGKRDTQPFAPVGPRSITDTNPALPPVVVAPVRERRGSFLNTLALLLVALAAVAVIVFVAAQLITQPPDTTVPPGPDGDILVELPSSPTFTPMPTFAIGPTPTPLAIAGAAQVYDGRGVLVTINMVQRSWLRIISDGVEQFAGVARPGQPPLEYRANESVSITASNAEALVVTYNGQPQGAFGGRGQKVDITFTMNGVQVSSGPGFDPTSEFTPTPPPTSAIDVQGMIAALTPSNTPGPSPTASDTPTASFTPTITLTPSITPTPSDTPTITPTPSNTAPPTNTLPPTRTPLPTSTPTATRTPLPPTPTAVLPPRVTQEGLPPTKPAG